jgi:hypothetical protein
VEEWRSWSSEPPQIADAPIEARLSDSRETSQITTVADMRRLGAISESLEWRPLGQYREEFHQVTGEWV